MAKLMSLERTVPCAVQRTAVVSRQMHAVAPRMSFVKASVFAASKSSRSAAVKVCYFTAQRGHFWMHQPL